MAPILSSDARKIGSEFGLTASYGHAREFAVLRLLGSITIAIAILALAVALVIRGGKEEEPAERSLSRLLAERGGSDFAYSSTDGAVAVSVRSLGFEATREDDGKSSLLGRVTAVLPRAPSNSTISVPSSSNVGSGYIIIGRVIAHQSRCPEGAEQIECVRINSIHGVIRDNINGASRIVFRDSRVYEDDSGGTYTCGHYRIYKENQFLPDTDSVYRPFISPAFADLAEHIVLLAGIVYIDHGVLNSPELSSNERRVLGHPCFAASSR
ncbi:MAG: hypothetical protein OD811_03575 [Alphaproteobacteria bacterium]